MPKRYFKYYLTAITAILFIACSEKDTLNGEGMLHLKVGVTDQVKVTTRSMTDELQDSLQRHCTIGILNEKGTVRRYKGVNELPEALTSLPAATQPSLRQATQYPLLSKLYTIKKNVPSTLTATKLPTWS